MGSVPNESKGLTRRLEALQRLAALASGLVIIVLMLITVYEVAMRYLFRLPTGRTQELQHYYLLVGVVFFAIGFVLLEEGHVNVDLVTRKMSRRARLIAEGVIGSLIIICFAGLLVWGGTVLSLRHVTETTSVTAMPLFPGYLMIPIGSLLLLVQAVLRLIRNVRLLASMRTARSAS